MAESNPPPRSSYIARVETFFDHTDDTRSLFLRLPDGFKLKFSAGQFISILIPLGDETRRRPYSIVSTPPQSDLLEICFNRVANGRGVEWLFERVVGDPIEFMGPFGAFTMTAPPQIETIFVAEGTAIAPILPMLHLAQSGPHASMLLLYTASSQGHILYRKELENLAAHDSNFKFETTIHQPDLYEHLYSDVNRRWVAADTSRARQFYICGIGKSVTRMRDLLRSSGYERREVHYEQW
ncbi:MAG TPA: FAD-dependent oxidoreductase [Candidatus Binataceae bacterium]|nr:FAD-dependent oxidoreductase [Candidatus Binataceae bacterium]